MNYRRIGRWAAAGLGVAAAGAGLYWLRERSVEKPDYTLLASDGEIELRRYPALLTAETLSTGGRDRALGNGFGLLADYIFAEGREGEEIAMTAPVIAEGEGGGWRVRFVMPRAFSRETLPEPTQGVTIGALPARRVAAIRFGGRVDDALLAARTQVLQAWMEKEGLTPAGAPQHAFYNSPFIPGPLRQNEVWIAVA